MPRRRLLATALAVTASLGLAACGNHEEEVTKGETEGISVTVDELKYQVQISRILNPSDAEDRSYLAGLPDDAEGALADGEEWFGVFLRIENETDEVHQAASDIKIEDTTGAEFEPLEVDPEATPLAYVPRPVEGGNELPDVGGVAQTTTTAGSLLLFKIPRQNLENRPLELIIRGGEGEATVDLDV